MTRTSEETKERIASAFSHVKAPSAERIAVGSDWDAEAIAKAFSPFLAKRVPASTLESHAKSLPAFAPEAFLFFLKDYLRYSLDHPNTELTEHLIYRLSSVKPSEPYWAERLRLFSDEQRQAITAHCEVLRRKLPKTEAALRKHLEDAIRAWSEKPKRLNKIKGSE